jgi:hypothetical protein
MNATIARMIDVTLTQQEAEEALMAYCFQKLGLDPSKFDVAEAHIATIGPAFWMNIIEIESKPLTPNEQ